MPPVGDALGWWLWLVPRAYLWVAVGLGGWAVAYAVARWAVKRLGE